MQTCKWDTGAVEQPAESISRSPLLEEFLLNCRPVYLK